MRPPGLYHGDVGCGTLVAIAATVALAGTLAGMTSATGEQQATRACAPVVSTSDAQSPLQVHAKRALASSTLAKWERNWYEKIVAGTVTPKRVTVWQTSYGPWDRGRYKGDLWHLACNPCNLKPGTVVWLPSTGRLMVVTNKGAAYNDVRARKHGAAFWIDLWSKRRGTYRTGNGDCWIIGRAPWKH